MTDIKKELRSGAFGREAQKYYDAGYSVIPIDEGTKAPKGADLKNWSSFCATQPSTKNRELFASKYGDHGIGLTLGMERKPGFILGAIDVDRDDLVAAVEELLDHPICAKKGRKGITFLCLAEKGIKKTMFPDCDGKGAIDILLYGSQTVIPPSLHPDTEKPYHWRGPSLLDVSDDDLPVFTPEKCRWLKALCKSEHLPKLIAGQTTHYAGLAFTASLIAVGCPDDMIRRIIPALLPSNYDGDTLDEMEEWITSAHEKGFGELALPVAVDERIARAVAEQLSPLIYVHGDGFLRYKDGHWAGVTDRAFLRVAKEIALPLLKAGQQVSPFLKNAYGCASLSLEAEGFGEYSTKICLQNGTVDMLTGKISDWSPDSQIRYQLDFAYDPSASCPLYEQQLRETLCEDQKAIDTFEEFAGLTLIPNMSFQKALYFMGPGGSGKSTLLKVLEFMHSPDAISVTPLDKIDNERYLTDVVRKLVCISFDVQTGNKVFGEAFIRITGGDMVATRRLYNEVDGRVVPTVRFIGSMNLNMPPFLSAPDALQRRLIFLRCGQKVTSPDINRIEKLKGERSGILNRWIVALRRLIERGYFDPPDSSWEEVNDYVNTQDPVQLFIDDMLDRDPTARTPVCDIVREYNTWAGETNERPLSANVLGKRLRSLGLTKSFSKDESNKSTRVYPVRIKRQGMRGF